MASGEKIESVASALGLIELLGQSNQGMSFTGIVDRTGRPKSSIHRMLMTLVHCGFVERDGSSGRYRVGLKLWGLGAMALGGRDLPTTSRPHLRNLMLATEETVILAIMLEGETSTMYIDKVDGPKMVHVNSPVGLISPAWCTATGRSMLAHRGHVWDRVLAGPFKKLTQDTTTDPRQLKNILERVVIDGYAITRGERSIEHGGIAAPIRDHTGAVSAACGLALPIYRMNKALVSRCVPLVVETAAVISKALGWRYGRKDSAKAGQSAMEGVG